MKAIGYNSYGDIDNLEILEVAEPRPKRSEVIVKIEAVSLNPVDIKKMQGGFKPITNLNKFPIFTACDFSGEITEIGRDVGAFKVGDKVFGMTDILFNGSAAEKIKISQKLISLVPKNIKLHEAAAIPQVANTSLLALRNIASIRKGHKILINGASGGVGSFAIQMAKIYETEITAVTSDRNYEWIKNDFNIDVTTKNNIYNNIDVAKQLFQRKKSRVVLSGRTSTANLDLFRMWIEDGKIKPIIEKIFSFDQYLDAYNHLKSGRAKGKILLTFN